MSRGRIAVVITCHNLGRYLDEALRSVERQTRPADEILIVDDGSTDLYTRQRLAKIQRAGTRVVCTNSGAASAARNAGARETTADYLAWLDADDRLEPRYLEAAAAPLDADPALQFVTTALRAFGDVSYVWTPSSPSFVDAVATGGVPHASTLLRRSLWEQLGGFDEELGSYELLDFWASAFERQAQGIVLDEPLVNYRVRARSGYRRSIELPVYLARMEHFYAKHRAAVHQSGTELLYAKERFLLAQRQHRQALEDRTAQLTAELARLEDQIREAAGALAARGAPRLDPHSLQDVEPVSPVWGLDRGTPIDRHYIEDFLFSHRADVKGRVLEVRDDAYTRRFGGDAVTASEVIDCATGNSRSTVTADLRRMNIVPSGAFDCIILTQTLQLVDDVAAAVAECARILAPGGVLLVTAPGLIRVDVEAGADGDFWRFTEASARSLFSAVFALADFDVQTFGNVAAAGAFLHGVSAEELTPQQLNHNDPGYPVVVAVRAVKPKPEAGPPAVVEAHSFPAAILVYHRVADLQPDSHALCLPPAEFRAQMIHLRQNFNPISLDDLVRYAASGHIPERAVVVTLDDGYLDALTVASPILEAAGVPATFFVNSDRLDEPHERWWDVLEGLFLADTELPAALELVGSAAGAGGSDIRTATASPAGRAEALDRVNRAGWASDAEGRDRLLDAILDWSGGRSRRPPRASHRVLTGAEVAALAARPGHAIGAHTVHHLALTTQTRATKDQEIFADKSELERRLGCAVNAFSYPYGEYDAETVAVVSAAGYRAAVTVEPRLVRAGANRLLLPRYEVTRQDGQSFDRRMGDIFTSRA